MRLPVSLKPSPEGKVAPQGRMRGRFIMTDHLRTAMAGSPLISQRAGPLTASVYALRAAYGGCAPTRACGRSPAGEAILPGGFNVNAHFRHQKRLRVPPVGGGVPDAPREG